VTKIARKLLFSAATIAAVVIVGLAAVLWRNHVFNQAAAALMVSDYAQAHERLKLLADLGDSKAQALLGDFYAFGWGVRKDDQQAVAWYRRAGPEGESARDPAAPAEYYTGLRYWKGEGVPRNEAEARRWFERSAEGGYSKAADLLSQMTIR